MLLVKSHPCPTQRRSVLGTLTRWRALRRERLALAQLEPAALKDLGISPAQAEQEAKRPFWDAPSHWTR
jgi:uncharacterized protein YjiS (DUF1127 family)